MRGEEEDLGFFLGGRAAILRSWKSSRVQKGDRGLSLY